ncbi:MAG: glycosyltransferase family 1 protein [Candidatus Brocadia sp.]|nr:glycosyltransferase family 1 protein [Candidatus Brocadia sp.]
MVYEVGKEIVPYKNKVDCAKKIKWLLASPKEATKIREAGRKRTLRDHTREKRFEEVFRLAGIME